jgi:FkbM family methyltransferase
VKDILKQNSMLVAVVRWARAQPARIFRNGLRVVLSWAYGTRERRLLLYEALSGRFAYAEHPEESYFVNTSDEYIGRMLYARGDFDLKKFEKACSLIMAAGGRCNSTDLPVLLDVGANIGSICIPAVKRGLADRAIAIEPDGENFRLLQINVLLNEIEDLVETRRAAVGETSGFVTLSRNAENSGDHRVATSCSDGSDAVPMMMLDDLADQIDLSNAILWMDIQGYEGFAVRGARRLVDAGVPIVLEFTKQDLIEAGCFDLLLTELSRSPYTVYFDLNDAAPKRQQLKADALRSLADKLDAEGAFTDLLLMRE